MTNEIRKMLLIESDPETRAFLVDNFSIDGYDVEEHLTPHVDMLGCFPDVVVVDVRTRPGLELVLAIRNNDAPCASNIAIVGLANGNGDLDVVRALDTGCDDAVNRPFTYSELRARVGAQVRRYERKPQALVTRVGALEVNATYRTCAVGGTSISLTRKEFDILVILARDPHKIVRKEDILRALWGEHADSRSTRTVESHVCRLRGLLSINGHSFIQNIWGVGYRLVFADDEQSRSRRTPHAIAAPREVLA